MGGIKVKNSSGSGCTLGVNVSWNDGTRKGFITASHCTEKDYELDNSSFEQVGTVLGQEVVDREVWHANTGGDSYCDDPNYKCRYSDAALVEYNTSEMSNAPIGFVAQPNYVGTDELDGTGDLYGYEIQQGGWVGHSGMTVQKVGMKTGLTTGEVTSGCADAFADAPLESYDYMYVCISEATYESDDGDSGAPVLYDEGAIGGGSEDPMWPQVVLMGFHLGGNNSEKNYTIFSQTYYVLGDPNNCMYNDGSWLNSEVCEEPNYGPYEFRESLAQ